VGDHQRPDPAEFDLRQEVEGAEATEALGARVAGILQGGEIILLHGDLGAGKTCFTRGLCRGLATDLDAVSPTFTLVNTYLGRLKVHHLDFYRVEEGDSLEDIGVPDILDEVFEGGSIIVVEWPERILPALGNEPRIELMAQTANHPDRRIWLLRGHPTLPAAWTACWQDPEGGSAC
jgi:tRNA threonylcarbamoyladenosine biosynthesis protein TsaE